MTTALFAAIRAAVQSAQEQCVCEMHSAFCILTDSGERAAIQPFVYL